MASQFHADLVDRLLGGALDALTECGVERKRVTVVRVPGTWEIPLALQELASTGRADGLVALGVLIRGETAHFDVIAAECSRGCLNVSLEHRIPVALGVLTCNTEEQARERCGGRYGNKGHEAAMAALDMVETLSEMRDALAAGSR